MLPIEVSRGLGQTPKDDSRSASRVYAAVPRITPVFVAAAACRLYND